MTFSNCWARQTGKSKIRRGGSFTFNLRRLVRGLTRRRTQVILTAGARQSQEVIDKVRMHCYALKVWCGLGVGGICDAPGLRASGRLTFLFVSRNTVDSARVNNTTSSPVMVLMSW